MVHVFYFNQQQQYLQARNEKLLLASFVWNQDIVLKMTLPLLSLPCKNGKGQLTVIITKMNDGQTTKK